MKTWTIPADCLMRTNNPTARITSRGKGLPKSRNFVHAIKNRGVLAAIKASYYQTSEEAFEDAKKHSKIYLGDELHVTVEVDRYGNIGTLTRPTYAIRQGNTIKSLLPMGNYPRHQAAEPCHLTEEDISSLVMGAIKQGVKFSYSIVRPRFGKISGDILIFWPSQAGFYGSAAMDKLGRCADLSEYTEENPLDPPTIHVGMPWLSKQEFGGDYTILCGSGSKRHVVVNGGWYDGGVKKPITFQRNEAILPVRSNFVIWHYAMTRMRNGKVVAIGATTAAGKSEGTSDEMDLPDAGKLIWEPQGSDPKKRGKGKSLLVDISPKAALITSESKLLARRRVGSDDITALAIGVNGQPHGAEAEPKIFYRIDLCTGEGTLPFAERAARGEIRGRITYSGVGFDKKNKVFVPWEHKMLGTKDPNTNPRLSYDADANPDYEPNDLENPMQIDYLFLSIPVPFIPGGWHMPTILRLKAEDFMAQSLHGARANKGNPALGAVGSGRWAFEGYGGKKGFTLNTEALMFARDWTKFWCALNPNTPCFMVFNGYSAGMKQRFKYSGTFLWRALMENHSDAMLNAPILKVPGVFSGGVPDLGQFLSGSHLPDRKIWDPAALNQSLLLNHATSLDKFCYVAMNRIAGQDGLGPDSRRVLSDLMRRYSKR